MPQLTVLEEGKAKRTFTFHKPDILIGRAFEADVELPGNTNISRRHARISKDEKTYYIEDLGSKNGTYLNGNKITKNPINSGDSIVIGKIQILFELLSDDQSKQEVVLSADSSDGELSGATVIYSPNKILELIEEESSNDDLLDEATVRPSDVVTDAPQSSSSNALQQDAIKLRLLYEISKELISIKPLQEFLEMVVDLVFSVVDAERCFLMLNDEESRKLIPKVVRTRRSEGDDTKRFTISSTIAEKVVNEKIALLTTDAQQDSRFNAGQSILAMGIRSAMCVPLMVKETVLGIIYTDSLMSSKMFDSDDLSLLTAFANHAAIGIEQARLNEKIQREITMRTTLERYHSPEVIQSIMESGGSIKPSVQEITILYADIKGFTTMAETMPPANVAEMLNEYYSMMTDRIFHNEGTLDKFMGDAVMAIFGAPVAHPDDPVRAVRTAIEMQLALMRVNIKLPTDRRYNIRIGINSGKAITGDFGSQQRMEFTALGNTVNIAARIEHSVCNPGRIAVGEHTYKLTREHFEYKELGDFQVKGISKPIKVYEVVVPNNLDTLV